MIDFVGGYSVGAFSWWLVGVVWSVGFCFVTLGVGISDLGWWAVVLL